jgi:K+-sensing histidine kinase KdpD
VGCAGWIGGLRAGLIATAVSAILADFLFIPPFGSLFLPNPSDAFGVITFVLEATLISFLATFRGRARRTAEEASKRDESLTSQLRSEQQVAAAATRQLESSRERLAIPAATTADGTGTMIMMPTRSGGLIALSNYLAICPANLSLLSND